MGVGRASKINSRAVLQRATHEAGTSILRTKAEWWDIWEKAQETYCWPPSGADAKGSLIYQIEHFTLQALAADSNINLELLDQALAVGERALQPAAYTLPENFLSRERFDEVLTTLEHSSSPGVPYTNEAPTIGEWLEFDGIRYDYTKVERLWLDTQDVLEGRWDPVYRVFVKMEAHTRAKADVGRWRLIIGFPLCVQVAWKMLFDYGNNKFLDASYDIPIQHGFKLPQGVWKQYYKMWKAHGYNTSMDISAFDMSVTWFWVQHVALELRYRLTKGPHVGIWLEYARRLYRLAFVLPKLQFSTGEICELLLQAIQKSGSPNTIADNGLIRYIKAVYVNILNALALYPPGAFVGDDSLQKLLASERRLMMEAYKAVGLIVKCVETGMEFVGHRFTEQGPQPAYVGKHLWGVFHATPDVLPDYLESMARMYAHSPFIDFWLTLAAQMGYPLMSAKYYRTWYDTEEYDFRFYLSCFNKGL